jgi:Flp pilus assembly protein protease CpaA
MQEIVVLTIFLLPIILFFWAILDLIKRNFSNSSNKIVWALVIIFVPLIGSVLYLAAGRKSGRTT